MDRDELATLIADHRNTPTGCACGKRTSCGGLAAGFAVAEWAEHLADELADLLDNHIADLAGIEGC